ncbi:MAG: hypothetical protein HYT48_03095 [Candidatus Vogelbacteria bacterium]|nr:hypothetical protein [Candidatus Vogelbacteria bacterium]
MRDHGEALFRSYGCFFAEFLEEQSLVRLGLLDLTTCVGLRYGPVIDNFRSFSWKLALRHPSARRPKFRRRLSPGLNRAGRIYLADTLTSPTRIQ